MKVIGIDPGTRMMGWGVVQRNGTRLVHIDNGVIVPPPRDHLAVRLCHMQNELDRIIRSYAPDISTVEETFVAKNARSALILGHARGVAFAQLAKNGLDVIEYSPNSIKKSVTGHGHASKIQVQEMVKILLGLPEVAEENASDALAVAICHLHCYNPALEKLK